MKTIAILGGTGGFGARIAKQVAQEYPEISLLCTKTPSDNMMAVSQADIVIIAAPISKTHQTIREIGSSIRKDAIVIDVTSLKQKPTQRMKEYLPQTCTIIPTHPMFGPSLASIMGQVVVLTPDDQVKETQAYQFLKSLLQEKGAQIIETTPEKHDEVMATVQGLGHMTLFIMGETMRRMGVDLEFSEQFVSPIYKIMNASVARYIGQNLGLYADIQLNNPYISKVHNTFITVTKEFTDIVQQKDDSMDIARQEFISFLENTRNFFGEKAVEGQQYTDKIIFLLAKQKELLADKNGQEILVENIYTKERKTLQEKDIDFNQRIILDS